MLPTVTSVDDPTSAIDQGTLFTTRSVVDRGEVGWTWMTGEDSDTTTTTVMESRTSADASTTVWIVVRSSDVHTHTHTRLTALFRDYPGGSVLKR